MKMNTKQEVKEHLPFRGGVLRLIVPHTTAT